MIGAVFLAIWMPYICAVADVAADIIIDYRRWKVQQ